MNLPTEVFGEIVVAHAPEDLLETRSEELLKCLTSLERANVVLDIDHVEAIDSRGLETLLDVLDRLRERGGDLKLSSSGPVNRKILEISRLDLYIEVFESVIEAVKSYS